MTRHIDVVVGDLVAGEMSLTRDPISRRDIVDFTYSRDWLADPSSFAISPELPLTGGPQSPTLGRQLFGSFSDAAPDSWGRNLQTAERRRLGHSPSMTEVDSLLMVDDEQRQGALRFREDGRFIGPSSQIAGVMDLTSIFRAVQYFETHGEPEPGGALLLGGGSSPGGARPKSWVRDADGRVWLAKFPRTSDVFDEHGWEEVAMRMQRRAGIQVQPSRTIAVGHHRVFMTLRFDRKGSQRRPYMSMRTLFQLNQTDFGNPSYEEMAQRVARISSRPEMDAQELFRRAALAGLINNADDHMRNHGLLRNGHGWQLSPAFDVNPARNLVSDTPLVVGGDPGDRDPRQLIERADHFRMTQPEARSALDEVIHACQSWLTDAREIGINEDEIDNQSASLLHKAANINRSSLQPTPTTESGSVWVEPHQRRGRPVEGHWRRSPKY